MNSEAIVKVNQIAIEIISEKYDNFLKELWWQINNWDSLFNRFCDFTWQSDWYMHYVNFLEYYIKSKWLF